VTTLRDVLGLRLERGAQAPSSSSSSPVPGVRPALVTAAALLPPLDYLVFVYNNAAEVGDVRGQIKGTSAAAGGASGGPLSPSPAPSPAPAHVRATVARAAMDAAVDYIATLFAADEMYENASRLFRRGSVTAGVAAADAPEWEALETSAGA
jgi:hypothetical protein